MTHGEPATYPRMADVIGFCTAEQVTQVAEQVVSLQRDFGDRSNRKHARLKYTIDDRGLDWFRTELNSRLGFELEPARPYRFLFRGDEFGWSGDTAGNWHLTLFVPQGRVRNHGDCRMMSALREIARTHDGTFRLTSNQNLVISDVPTARRQLVDRLLDYYGVHETQAVSGLRQQALACVALPTCGLAFAEAERYLAAFTGKLEELMESHGLGEEAVSLRITGCPNGCARPYAAEIGLVGKAPGQYSVFLGGSADGARMNRLAHENLDEKGILQLLGSWLRSFAAGRQDDESFGDFVHRHDLDLQRAEAG
jgi:sulfite reductase (NADPH) hemoprotein beta-component